MSPRDISKLLSPIARRLRSVVARCVVKAANDGSKLQGLHVALLAGEEHQAAERFQQYGFSSVPQAGAEGIALAVGGDRSHLVVIAVDDRRYRVAAGQPGEVVVYDDLGHQVRLTREGIVIDGAGHVVTITNTPKLRVEGDIESTGNVRDLADAMGSTMAAMRTAYNGHSHGENDGGGPTDGPSAPM